MFNTIMMENNGKKGMEANTPKRFLKLVFSVADSIYRMWPTLRNFITANLLSCTHCTL